MNLRTSRRSATGKAASAATVPSWVYVLFGVFLVLDYTRISSVYPIIASLRPQFVIMMLLVFAWLRFSDYKALGNPLVRLVAIFTFLCALGTLYAPNNRTAFNLMTNLLGYLVAVVLPLVSFVRTVDRLKWFFSILVLSHTFIALWAITHSGTGPGGYVSDENDCALVLNVALPYAVALAAWPGQTRRARFLWAGCAALMVIGTMVTLSRGGFLGLVACVGAMVWYSKNRLKFVAAMLGLSVVLLPLAYVAVPDRYIAEIASIGDSSDGTRQNRLYFWKLGLMMYQANPVLGVGAGNYPWTVAIYERRLPSSQVFRGQSSGGRVAHSVYFTLLPELGTMGVLVFGSAVYLVIRTGRRMRLVPARKSTSKSSPPVPQPSAQELALDVSGRAIIASCFAYLATGAFISVLYYPAFWHMAGIAAAAGAIHASVRTAGEA